MRAQETVYLSGNRYFEDIFAAIDRAKSEILIETYIFSEGEVTRNLLTKLASAAAHGVDIKILVDAAGSYGHTDKLRQFCTQHTIQLKVFHPILWTHLMNTFKFLNQRDHRKLCIVDRQVAFAGSLNLSDVHIQKSGKSKAWKDFGISISGAGVAELLAAFKKKFGRKKIHERLNDAFSKRERNHPRSGVFLNDTLHKRRECYHHLRTLIKQARHRIWLANAYILPELKVQAHLEEAARRGVDVRILTSGATNDIFFMPFLTRLLYKRNLMAGVKLFEFLETFFHGKVFVIDDYVSIGSSNFNHRSLFHDLELDVVVTNEQNKAIIVNELERCFLQSKSITEGYLKTIPFWQTLIARMLNIFRYWF